MNEISVEEQRVKIIRDVEIKTIKKEFVEVNLEPVEDLSG